MNVMVTYNISIEDGLDLAKEVFSENDLRFFLTLGYDVFKACSARELDKLCNDKHQEYIESLVAQRVKEYDETVYRLQNENVTLADKLASKHQLDILNVTKKYDVETVKKDTIITMLEKQKDDLHQRVKDLQAELNEGVYKRLQDELASKDMELKLMKSTNAAKGVIGENMIIEILKNMYPDAELNSTRKVAHECDIQMRSRDGDLVVFESKYKSAIDKNDVNKFVNDVKGMGDTVTGGIFISILSRNIPGKGNISMEFMKDTGTPIIYMGFSNEQEFNMLFPFYVQSFIRVITALKTREEKQVIDPNEILDEVQFYLQIANDNIKKLDDFKTRFSKFATDIDKNNRTLLERIEKYISKHCVSMSSQAQPSTSPKRRRRTCHVCETCGDEFTALKSLKDHMKTHN
jgi:hypothetical protein